MRDELDRWVGKKLKRLCAEGHPLVIRRNWETGGYFLGCSTWPKCEWTNDIPGDLVEELEGHPRLPGMGARIEVGPKGRP